MSTSEKALLSIVALGIVVIIALMVIGKNEVAPSLGSVSQTGEYQSTTTDGSWNNGPFYRVAKTGQGTFGSVVITSATATVLNIYDATTTDITQRTGNLSTSTILLAKFGLSTAVGTYTFDSMFYRGLLIETTSGGGLISSSTITYR